MGMTMTQKILAAHAGLPEVKAGQLIRAKLDMVLGNDITSPVAIREFEKEGFTGVFDKSKISMVMDHFTPNKDIKAAEQCLQCRTFARQFDLDNFYDVGQMGVEHALLPEKGLVAAGECIIGADSHTCTYGALGAFSTGVGSTDMAAGMATGETWFKVPEAIRVHLTGKLQPWVSGKDVILHLIGLIGVDGALYQSLEYCGDGVAPCPWMTGCASPTCPLRPAPKTASSPWTPSPGPTWTVGSTVPTPPMRPIPTPNTCGPWRLT